MATDAKGQPHLTFLGHLPLTQSAVAFALEHHAGQRRSADHAPFILHTLEVASLLDRSGYPDPVVAAAVLHDVLEKTDADRSEVEEHFGAEVADLVAAVSDDPSIEHEEERKDRLRQKVQGIGGHAAAVYAADKVSKVRELRMLLARGMPDEQAEAILARNRRSLEMLDETIPGSRLVEVLRFELETLQDLPPASAEPIEEAPRGDRRFWTR